LRCASLYLACRCAAASPPSTDAAFLPSVPWRSAARAHPHCCFRRSRLLTPRGGTCDAFGSYRHSDDYALPNAPGAVCRRRGGGGLGRLLRHLVDLSAALTPSGLRIRRWVGWRTGRCGWVVVRPLCGRLSNSAAAYLPPLPPTFYRHYHYRILSSYYI